MPAQPSDLGRPLGRRPRTRPQPGAAASCSCSGSGSLAGATVAYAPYLGTALVALIVLLLRTASVTRQRHGRRRMVRGRARWYDVPTTTLSTPGYAVLALFGSVALVAVGALVGLAIFSLGYLLRSRRPRPWWSPGSGSPPRCGGGRARAGCAR